MATTQPLVGMIPPSPGPFIFAMSNIHIGRSNNCLTFHEEEDDNEQVRLTHLVEYSELVTMQRYDRQLLTEKKIRQSQEILA